MVTVERLHNVFLGARKWAIHGVLVVDLDQALKDIKTATRFRGTILSRKQLLISQFTARHNGR
jgi:hypothetical protein